ncbi:TrkH-domain-containing protein [Basidiobolus meristosporus CBS 931.73]|uniref:Potassium transport protein n=1 Tax=Basidiobolus meristosporus CBS 931.73 TaxID=1314790 RepID=A0A1Y1YG97_9FUNG|nr:TrkH-domain-containing protein [Basidiobolus meristosporus CBS 931.73]|eukprot:ORX96978.1 TrkH-domain-containing protein [Basidiobolus meristosporus CBS 931.73]
MVTYRSSKQFYRRTRRKIQDACATKLTFFRVHFLYFVVTIFIFSGLFYIDGRQLPYIDALFFSASAMTLTGLNTYNVSTFSGYQQALLFILMIMGSQVFVSLGLVQIRRFWFNQKFKEIVSEVRKHTKEAKLTRRKSEYRYPLEPTQGPTLLPENQIENLRNSALENIFRQEGTRRRQSISAFKEPDNPIRNDGENEDPEVNDTIHTTTGRSISYAPDVDNQRDYARSKRPSLIPQTQEQPSSYDNSDFVNPMVRTDTAYTTATLQLPHKEKMALGGLEYRGLLKLQTILPLYFVGFQLVIALLIRLWFALSREVTASTLTNNSNENPTPVNPWWFSFFITISAFNNVGFSLVDQNMVPFQTRSVFLLVCLSVLILVGNTAFALTLRLIIWLLWKCTPKAHTMRKNTYRFLLDHPRRCFTTLFPRRTTWLLFIVLIVLTLIDLLFFLVLNLTNEEITVLSWGDRVMDGLFQAFATRTGGFAVVGMAGLNSGLLVLYTLMMYVAVYPVAISMRHTNIYEERAIGVYQEHEGPQFVEDPSENSAHGMSQEDEHAATASSHLLLGKMQNHNPAFILGMQLRRQLFNDVGWIFIGLFIICSIESDKIQKDINISVFSILFEIVSAYANVGVSLGYPDVMYALSGKLSTASKFVILAIMVIGRHRGLPQAVDRAVMLPSEKLHEKELEDVLLRRPSIGNFTTLNQNTVYTTPSLRRHPMMPLRRVATNA